MRKAIMVLFVVAIFLGTIGTAGATLLQDQYSPFGSLWIGVSNPSLIRQQGITAGIAGRLDKVDIYAFSGSATFYLSAGPAFQSSPYDWTTTVSTSGSGWMSIDTSAANLLLGVGDQFIIGFQGNNSGFGIKGNTGGYSGGSLWTSSSGPTSYDGNITFKTFMEDSAAIPEPATMLLLGSGLIGLAGFRRKIKK